MRTNDKSARARTLAAEPMTPGQLICLKALLKEAGETMPLAGLTKSQAGSAISKLKAQTGQRKPHTFNNCGL